MEASLQRRVQRYGWDRAAADYESLWQVQLAGAQSQLLASASLAPGDRVLDVACGSGLVTFSAALWHWLGRVLTKKHARVSASGMLKPLRRGSMTVVIGSPAN
ncbi:MAG: hypothetical protein WAU49_10625, partial [Steroidobacteraceae bacterium]